MNTISNRPVLDEDAVEQALGAMRTAQALHNHPLQFFISVQSRLESPHVLSGAAAVQVAIYHHLADLVMEHLNRLRGHYGLKPCDPLDFDENDLRADFQPGNSELEAWSLLYHRYVCVDYDLTMQVIAAIVNQTERTLRRRHRLGLARLTVALIELEQTTRRQNVQRRLHLALPGTPSSSLFGAESLYATSWHLLSEAEPPNHLMLYGPAGIGKTALALVLAHTLVDMGGDTPVLDDLLWLDLSHVTNPTHNLALELAAGFALPASFDHPLEWTLRAYLYAHPALIVLDNADILVHDPERIESVITLLTSAQLILTSHTRAPEHLWLYQIPIPELEREAAFAYLDHLSGRGSSDRLADPDRFEEIWQAVGGNPGALKLLFQISRAVPVSAAFKQANIDIIFQQIWDDLPEDARRIWLIPLLTLPDELPYEHIHFLADCDQETADSALYRLVSAALLTVTNCEQRLCYGLPALTTTFFEGQIDQGLAIAPGESARDFLLQAANRQATYLVEIPNASAALILLKRAHEFRFSDDVCWQYVTSLAPQITEAGLWLAWSERLDALLSAPQPLDREAWLDGMMGIALRWLGQLDTARSHLKHALDYYRDDTAERANLLIELAVVYRYQGRWERAYQMSHTAFTIYQQIDSAEGMDRCVHELGQLAVDSNQPVQALDWLSRIDHWTARTWGVAGQAYLNAGQLEDALHAVRQSIDQLPVQHPNQGRAAATLGQIYAAMGDFDTAIDRLLLAVELTDQAKDMIGYARVCNNLAVAYLQQPPNERTASAKNIYRLLTQALHIQEHIGDEIGLAVTHQNLDWLNTSYHPDH